MKKIIIKEGKKPVQEFSFEDGVYLIGRKEENRIVLPDKSVSRQHAQLEIRAENVTIQDLDSANGVFKNGKQIEKESINEGDTVQIGKYSLELKEDDGEKTRMATSSYTSTSLKYRLVLMEGEKVKEEYQLDENELTIGRAEENKIILKNETVSRKHAIVKKENNQYKIADLGSSNGTFVNNKKIKEKDLSKGDEIKIGKFVLKFVTEGAYPEQGLFGMALPMAALSYQKKLVEIWNKPPMRLGIIGFGAVLIIVLIMSLIPTSSPEKRRIIDVSDRWVTIANLIKQGKKLHEAGQKTKALEVFNKVLQMDPENLDAQIYVEKSRGDEAIAQYLARGLEFYKKTQWENALRQFERVLSLDPENSRGIEYFNKTKKELRVQKALKLADEYIIADKLLKAQTELNKALDLKPEDAHIKKKLNLVEHKLQSLKHFKKGKEYFEKANYANALSELKKVSAQSKYANEAKKLVTQIGNMQKAEKFFVQAKKLYQKGSASQAVELMQKVLDVNRDYTEAQEFLDKVKNVTQAFNKGMSFSSSQQLMKAVDEWRQVLALEQDRDNFYHAEAVQYIKTVRPYLIKTLHQHMEKGRNFVQEEKFKAALLEFQFVLTVEPDHKEALKNINELQVHIKEKARELYIQGYTLKDININRAVKKWKQVLEIAPPDDEYYIKAKKQIKKHR
ncbi:FHA domain-containing protein [bacterium]|nr:FHA domain-containing protein [bacterium]